LIAAGEVDTAQGSFSVKIPSSFDEPRDIYNLPVKTNGDRVITLGDLADIRLTFEDRVGTARYNGETTVALQVVKRKGFNLIKTVALQVVKRKGFNLIKTAAAIRALIEEAETTWPPELRAAVDIGSSNDQSRVVASMVSQLEGSVLTAIALVMIVVLASLGTRAALLIFGNAGRAFGGLCNTHVVSTLLRSTRGYGHYDLKHCDVRPYLGGGHAGGWGNRRGGICR